MERCRTRTREVATSTASYTQQRYRDRLVHTTHASWEAAKAMRRMTPWLEQKACSPLVQNLPRGLLLAFSPRHTYVVCVFSAVTPHSCGRNSLHILLSLSSFARSLPRRFYRPKVSVWLWAVADLSTRLASFWCLLCSCFMCAYSSPNNQFMYIHGCAPAFVRRLCCACHPWCSESSCASTVSLPQLPSHGRRNQTS